MNRIATLFICVALAGFGCNKNRKNLSNAGDKAVNTDDGKSARSAPRIEQKDVATGDIKSLLLALKRVHFALDTNTLTSDARAALTEAADRLKDLPDVALYVDGHTDERGTTEYNISLGERRAQTVVDYLKRSGVASDQLSIVSFGEESPLDSGSDEMSYAKNRRVDFRLMRGNVQFTLEDSDPLDDNGKPIHSARIKDSSDQG